MINDAPLPPGPAEKFDTADDLLTWMSTHFERFGDIFSASIYGSVAYVISAPEYAEHVLLKNWQNYLRKGHAVKRIALSLGNGLISSNGEFWAKQRRMIQPAFTREAVTGASDIMHEVSLRLRDQWMDAAERRARVNVTRDVSFAVLEVTLRAIFGDDYGEVAPHFEIVAEGPRNLGFAQRLISLGPLIMQVAAQRRATGRSCRDILGSMMAARDRLNGDPMPDAQLAREALTLLVAGHETTASVLSWTWYLLSAHPAVDAKLATELAQASARDCQSVSSVLEFPYTRRVIEEALRLYPPLWLMTRKAQREDRLGEYFVPPGTEIYISPYLIQRHPALWQRADTFEPERFDCADSRDRHRLAMCPFGAGPRNCIGEFFALIEMQIHLATIARALRLRRADEDPPELVAGVNLLSKRDFIMEPASRADSAR